jgi:hypothetical protein
MFIYIGLALLLVSFLGVSLHPNQTTWLDSYVWIPAFWIGGILVSGSVLTNILWAYWP